VTLKITKIKLRENQIYKNKADHLEKKKNRKLKIY